MAGATVGRGSAERLVLAGTMGPTIHDVHAWRLRLADGHIEIHADPERFRAMDDPTGRSLHLSCGAAIVNLRLAAAQLSHEAVVRLVPDPEHPVLLASIRLAPRRPPTRTERLLYSATMRPFPARGSRSAPPPRHIASSLADVARLEGASLHLRPGGRAVLTTSGDSPAAWLRAGRALQSVLLAATVRGVAASFLYEVVSVPDAHEYTAPGDVPQVLLELAARLPVDRQDERQRHLVRVGQLRDATP
ncbi:hypothetical protein [Actinomadura flavalba]|uniref:hypothetical protein n=1 Tax=Actinomadura flavalba TaxID=1120938 RepID=UPI0003725191|nr:hypothetical protein [Actinomadura flavalba]